MDLVGTVWYSDDAVYIVTVVSCDWVVCIKHRRDTPPEREIVWKNVFVESLQQLA